MSVWAQRRLMPYNVGMPHILEQKITAVRRRVRRLLLVDAAARLVALLLATALVLGLADYLVRFEDRGVRLISSLALVAACGWAFHRFVGPALRIRLSDVELALQLEQRLPILRDRLASAMRFLCQREDDALAGSSALRRAVIAAAAAEVDRLNLDDAIEPHAARRSLWTAAAAMSLLLVLAACNLSAAATAFVRLMAPWGSTEWPKQNHLVFEKPVRRLAAGQTFEVELKDAQRARLPDEVMIQYRFDEPQTTRRETSERMRRTNDVLLARKENVTRPFSYRAAGGDDDSMPWIDLEIVEPPRIEELVVTLHFPEYTSWPREISEPHLRALVGTRIELAGRTNKPVNAVNVHVDEGAAVPARLSDGGRRFSVPGDEASEFKVERSGAYWIELVDFDGFSSGEQLRYAIRAVEDFTPSVDIVEPQAVAFVTPSAKVPIRLAAKDDLALAQVALRFSRTDRSQEDEAEIVVYQGPDRAQSPTRAGQQVESGESRDLLYELDLAALAVKPGTQITLYATASDYYPHRGQSQPHRLTVITADELRERLAQRQNFVVSELARILKLQRDARSQLSDAQIQLQQVGRLKKPDIDRLQAAELIQRQVERGLISPSEGLSAQIAGLLADLAQNDLDSPDVERQMQGLLDEIDRLGRDELPSIGGELTAALKAAQVELPAGERASDASTPQRGSGVTVPLEAAAGHQDEVIQTLERLTASLAESENYRRFHREIAALRRQQEDLNRESAELGRRTITQEFSRLAGQEQADLSKLASRQLELARQFDKIQERMQGPADDAAALDPLSAGSIADALSQARRQAIAQTMHEAGRKVASNQLGQAAQDQRRATDDLQEMLDILANRREHELGRLVKKLRDAQGQLAELQQEQQGLRKKWQAVAEETGETNDAARRRQLERLTREQQETADATQRLARSLERLQAERAARKASHGGAKMNRAGRQARQGQADAAADSAADAERDLEEAQHELAKHLAQAEADLAQEQMARLEDQLKAIADAESKLLEETRHYAEVERSQHELTRAQAIGVGDLGKRQHAVRQETADLAEKLAGTPVFRLAFEQAAHLMRRAAKLLDEHNTGETTQQAETRAVELVTHALEALQPAPNNPSPEGQPDDNSGQGEQPEQENANAADATQALAELKLLKWMQDDVNQRTQALADAYRDATDLPPDAQREYQELSEQQGKIAELTLKLAKAGELKDNNGAPEMQGESK